MSKVQNDIKLYPMLFEPVYKKNLWGGTWLSRKYDRSINDSPIGESWDVSCHSDGLSIIRNGDLKGNKLIDVFKTYREQLVGKEQRSMDMFPLLIKIIDASDRLSLQVHPDDDYAFINEHGQSGKNEAWYVIKAEKNAKIILGLKEGVTKEQFCRAVNKGMIHNCLNEILVNEGDVINIPAGVIHAIGRGIMIAEVQQNSNLVYRVHDWERTDVNGHKRELHLKKALDVIDFEHRYHCDKTIGFHAKVGKSIVTHYVRNTYFTMDTLHLVDTYFHHTLNRQMLVYMCIEGHIDVIANDITTTVYAGETVLIPASTGAYFLEGQALLLKIQSGG